MPNNGWSKIIAIVLSQKARRISEDVSIFVKIDVILSTKVASESNKMTANPINANNTFRLYKIL